MKVTCSREPARLARRFAMPVCRFTIFTWKSTRSDSTIETPIVRISLHGEIGHVYFFFYIFYNFPNPTALKFMNSLSGELETISPATRGVN